MKIYIDSDYKCHVSDDGTMREFDVPEFDGKCKDYVEGFCFVPEGEIYTNERGNVFGPQGDMFFAWKDYNLLEAAQAAYEEVLNSADNAYSEGVNSI